MRRTTSARHSVVDRVVLVVDPDRGRRDVIAAPPDLDLVEAVAFRRLAFVEALERPVVTLVQSPRPLYREVAALHLVEREVRRPDRPPQHRRMDSVDLEIGLGRQQPTCFACLGLAALTEVDVRPAGEAVLGIPGALAMAEDDEGRHGARRYLPDRGRSLAPRT